MNSLYYSLHFISYSDKMSERQHARKTKQNQGELLKLNSPLGNDQAHTSRFPSALRWRLFLFFLVVEFGTGGCHLANRSYGKSRTSLQAFWTLVVGVWLGQSGPNKCIYTLGSTDVSTLLWEGTVFAGTIACGGHLEPASNSNHTLHFLAYSFHNLGHNTF